MSRERRTDDGTYPEVEEAQAKNAERAAAVAAARSLTKAPAADRELTTEQLVVACRNIGFDLTCGACAMLFYTGYTGPTARHDMMPPDHEAGCKTLEHKQRLPTSLHEERECIKASHPLVTGRHDLYNRAMRLVGERHAKGDLVDLVVWLLSCAEPRKS